MPTFQYEAVNESGKRHKGTVSAVDDEEALTRIRAMGYFPTSVRKQKVEKTKTTGGKDKKGKAAPAADAGAGGKRKLSEISIDIGGVSQKQLTAFTRQLSTLQDAGLPILRSLAILEQQQKPGMFKRILKNVHDEVSGGSTLSDSMSQNPKAFDKLYTKMIQAGEIGGVLDLILARLADFMEKAAKLKAKIISAMIYPMAVVSVAVVIVVGIMIFIVPRFEGIFADFDTELPGLTKFLINSSRWLLGSEGQIIPGVVWVVLSPILFFIALKLIRKTKMGKATVDRIALKLPVVGNLIAKTAIAKFTRTLGTLINAGVPILDAINITREATGNYVFSTALGRVHDSVRQGESFAGPLGEAKVCDPIVINMIDVGEETGELDKMLIRVADNYEEEVDTLVGGLVSLLEPVMVVALGLIVGFIVIALFMPLVSLIDSVMG